jgi:hypothetical protein
MNSSRFFSPEVCGLLWGLVFIGIVPALTLWGVREVIRIVMGV